MLWFLGGVGDKNEIDILLNILKSNDIAYIRGFSATAIRQIWFNHPEHKEYIIKNLSNQIDFEKDEFVLAMIIITLQDVMNYRFGLKECENGEISGNLELAKENIKKYKTRDQVVGKIIDYGE